MVVRYSGRENRPGSDTVYNLLQRGLGHATVLVGGPVIDQQTVSALDYSVGKDYVTEKAFHFVVFLRKQKRKK